MRKFLCFAFILIIFSIPVVFVNTTFAKGFNSEIENGGLRQSCLINLLGERKYLNVVVNKNGEQVEFDSNEMNVSKILSILGARIVEEFDMSVFKVVNAISKRVGYKISNGGYNIQIKVGSKNTIVASPKFLI